MNDHSSSDDQSSQLEEIVAYLDGELSPQESAQVERRLASDETYRQKLQSLQRAWAALDELPAATVDDKFSQTTMEMVVESARSDVEQQTQALPMQRRKQRLSTMLLATTAILLGALCFRLLWENPNRALVADLPVIQYIDIYSQFHDVDFLRQLRQHLGDGHWAIGADSEQPTDNFDQFQLVASVDDRVVWLESLAGDERVTLRAKFNRFRSMSVQQQNRLRALHQQIESASDAAELQQTMLEYQLWLDDLPPSEQFELREQPTEDRVREVVFTVQGGGKLLELTPDELQKLFQAARPHLAVIRERTRGGMSRRLSERNIQNFRELIRAVHDALPEEKREKFDKLTPPEQLQQLYNWMREAGKLRVSQRRSGDRRRADQPSEQELERYFVEEVDAATKAELLAMPLDRMQHQLRQMYRGNLPMRGWGMFGEGGERERGRRGPPPRGEGRRRPDGPPPGSRDRRGPPHFREGPPRPPPEERPPN